ncbi:hypothetical protein [Candidatus Coxiella mudrowiae]|uniref:hypothetical protein n=1 Tax=Candidatus Coxiella mudrowiae TaxID=2054173 RepID=UPI0012FEE436|nr:hypothetical protein [Candidatus Coxiella mudrowiae]
MADFSKVELKKILEKDKQKTSSVSDELDLKTILDFKNKLKKLKIPEKSKEEPPLNDVASILVSRMAMELSDSESEKGSGN